MKNYVYLYFVSQHIPDTDEQNAVWNAWFESIGEHIVDGGNPFNPEAQAQVADGKVTMDADEVAGYTIVKASSLEEAVTWVKEGPLASVPHLQVRVYETMPM